MPTTAIRRPVVAGAGTMGVTLARIFAQAGYAVTLWNRRTSSLDRAQERIAGDLADRGRLGVKSGAGFYDYADGQGEAKRRRRDELFQQLWTILKDN